MENHIKNITEMENILNETDSLISEMEVLIKKWKKNQNDFARLMSYYGSENWHKDREDDDAGIIPQDLPRGVLSEDAVHNTFGNRREISIELIKTGVADLE